MTETKIEELFQPSLSIQDSRSSRIKSLSKKLKEKTSELISETTVHALPNIVRTEYTCIKIMWIIFFTISTSGAVYFTYYNIIGYLDFDVITNYEMFYERQSEFPTVSFCSKPGFALNTSLETLIYECFFNGNNGCFLNKSQFFESYYDAGFQKCFRFNGLNTKDLKSTYAGNRYGLILNLNMNPSSLLIISINNRSAIPYTLFNSEIRLATGSLSEFVISRLLTDNLPEPYNRCYKDVSLYAGNQTFIKMILKDNRTYSQKECLEFCSYAYYLDNSNCGCKSTVQTVLVSCYVSADEKSRLCTRNFTENFLQDKINEVCAAFCPLECDSLDYSLDKFSTHSNVITNRTSVTVFYNSLKYILISQQAKTLIIDLVPNIGGILGLFIGISFLSFIEIFEFIAEYFFIFCDNKIKPLN